MSSRRGKKDSTQRAASSRQAAGDYYHSTGSFLPPASGLLPPGFCGARCRIFFLVCLLSRGDPSALAQRADTVQMSVDASILVRRSTGTFLATSGASRYGVYEGIWVGPDSKIPNTRGIRTDVAAALKALKVPTFAGPAAATRMIPTGAKDWPRAVVTLNPNWGGVVEPNTFRHARVHGLPRPDWRRGFSLRQCRLGYQQEAAEWLEYLTTPQQTVWQEAGRQLSPAPYKIAFLGIGNEVWDCGGNMTPDYYTSQLKIYSRFARNFNPAQQGNPQCSSSPSALAAPNHGLSNGPKPS